MTKTDRILSYLPPTFAVQPPASPLRQLIETYGKELQAGENALAAILRAHWVDHADRAAPAIDDLARIAALYGLAPRPNDTIEEFRTRLKNYVRTFLEGTTTVQGLLRITADVLGLTIADNFAADAEVPGAPLIDAWWERTSPALVTFEPDGTDLTAILFAGSGLTSRGRDVAPAEIVGHVVLGDAVDLSGGRQLAVRVDGPQVLIDVAAGGSDPAAVPVADVVSNINTALGTTVASLRDDSLVLTAPTAGAASVIIVDDTPDDAAGSLLGLAPRVAGGAEAAAATIVGTVDLPATVDLSGERYLRLVVDGTVQELDLAGPTPAATSLDDIVGAINASFAFSVASHDGSRISLVSPTIGAASTLQFLQPAAQDARVRLFGTAPVVAVGQDDLAAVITGSVDLSGAIDLSAQHTLVVSTDGQPPVPIDCRGTEPSQTELPEIVDAINAELGALVASSAAARLVLTSPSTGVAAALAIADANDATDASNLLLGLNARTATGRDAKAATLTTIALPDGIDVRARHKLRLAIDGAPPMTLDLRAACNDLEHVSAGEIAAIVNAAPAAGTAAALDNRVIITSSTEGATSRVALTPIEHRVERSFVTRAPVTDEVAPIVMGFASATATGTAPSAARITGRPALDRGVDLSAARFLALEIDGAPAVDIDCAGPRPRTTTIDEVIDQINDALPVAVASHDGRHVTLSSPSTGAASRIAFAAPRATDAAATVLGLPLTTARGAAAQQVSFAGTRDLSGGVDLSTADQLRLAVDGGTPVDVACAGPDPTATTAAQVAIAINLAMGTNIASHDGSRVLLTAPSTGDASKLEILTPTANDASSAILGISTPRTYTGRSATAATLLGDTILPQPLDLSTARFLRVAVDSNDPEEIDLAGAAADASAVTVVELVSAINGAFDSEVASITNDQLLLVSPSTGLSSRITVAATQAGDARTILFGDEVVASRNGSPALPATINGQVDLTTGVTLGERTLLRMRVDGAIVVVDLATEAGPVPGIRISGASIAAAFDEVASVDAQLTDSGALRLSTVSVGEDSRLSIETLRFIEVIDYPPQPVSVSAPDARHGSLVVTRAQSATATIGTMSVAAPFGTIAPGLANFRSAKQIRVLTVVQPGEEIRIGPDEQFGVRGLRLGNNGAETPLPASHIVVGPLGAPAFVPTTSPRWLVPDSTGVRSLVLNNPLAPNLLILRVRTGADVVERVRVHAQRVTHPQPMPDLGTGAWVGWLRWVNETETADTWLLEQADGGALLALEVDVAPPAELVDQVVAISGTEVPGIPNLVRVSKFTPLFDVEIHGIGAGGTSTELFSNVSIGEPTTDALALYTQVMASARASRLVKAIVEAKADSLAVAQGRTEWRATSCFGSRYDVSDFDDAQFANVPCEELGIFNVSTFATSTEAEPSPVRAVFATTATTADDAFAPDLRIDWNAHAPGHLEVNLPRELPARFGARFNEDRFARSEDEPETFEDVVTEPLTDPDFVVNRINAGTGGSVIVIAERVDFVPIGFVPVPIPFARPVPLSGGNEQTHSQIFLANEGLPGFVRLYARGTGSYGNAIKIVMCDTSPGRYDLLVTLDGARFENARIAVMGEPLSGITSEHLAAQPLGLVQAKAAGVHANTTRTGT